MHKAMNRMPRRWFLPALVVASGWLAGCDDFMRVTNPGAIEEPALANPNYVQLMVNGVIGDFQPAFGWTAVWSGVFTDELYNHHGYFEYPQLERRQVEPTDGTYALGIYNGLHRVRFLADSVAGRLGVMLADSASRDLRLARVQAYGGYAWTLLGEQMCQTPINGSREEFPSEVLLQRALERFDAAIRVATASRAAAANVADARARARLAAGADSIANLARVGAARASLDLWSFTKNAAHRQKAIEHASQVTPAFTSNEARGFEFFVTYAPGSSFSERRRISNPAWEFVSAGRWFSLAHTPFEGLTDPRIPKSETLVRVTSGQMQYLPNSPLAYSTYTGTLPGKPFEETSDIRLASALEARYILAEAQGASAANLAFLNQRRAIGGDAPLAATATEEAYLRALRDQRSRDLYLDTHRLADLRRYKAQYGIDLFPSGTYPDNPSLTYGTQECWPVPISEQNR